MTSAARRVSSLNDLELAVQAKLSSVNAVLALSAMLTQSSSPSQAMRLVTTAVPSIASCHKALAWHPSRSGDYYERAPDNISGTLAKLAAPRRLEVDHYSSWWVFPLGPSSGDNPIFLVTVGTEPLSDEETFLISVLARLCGTVIAKLELLAAERASTQRAAALNAELESTNAELESTVSTLTKIMETHRRLNEIVATAGEMGIATTVHLWVPRTSSTLCDQAIFVEQNTGASLSSNAVLLKIDRFGQRFQQRRPVQETVRPVLVVVVLVIAQDPPQMALVPGKGAVRELASASPDPAFGNRVHAGRPHVAQHGPDPGIGEDRVECGGEVRATVADHELHPLCLPAEVHGQVAGLLGSPFPGWVQRDAEDADAPRRVPDHRQDVGLGAVEQVDADEVAGQDCLGLGAQEL
jgi:hypothetical protein